MTSIKISPTAVISPKAVLGANVEIGAYTIIGDNVCLKDNTTIMHHSIIDKNTTIGENSKIYPFASIGTDPQDITFAGEETFVEIGENNTIREFTTINRGTAKGGCRTIIGNNNFFMAYSHIGHDCQIGNNTQLLNGATLAGHVEVEDSAVIGAFSSVHQFTRIGRNAYIGGYTVVLQDILPFVKIAQQRHKSYNFYGPNSIGMMRRGISREFINKTREIFNTIYRSNLNTTQAIEKIKQDFPDSEETDIIIEFIRKSKRGILKNFSFNV